ncbi:hypothetical protein [Microbacterium sp. Leaf288]|uniref:hypothetical protein n=1 Tax=Microbacterium sp. Leaf288 TaxID=1736323 RepID=UPI0009E8FCEE|nr:hypothetical protein [Microbacterium sp. Leaf288]
MNPPHLPSADAFSGRPVAEHRAAVDALVASIPRGNERLPIDDPDIYRGRCLAADFIARSALPPFGNSQMDGFAVRTSAIAHAEPGTPAVLRRHSASLRRRARRSIADRHLTPLAAPRSHAAPQAAPIGRVRRNNSWRRSHSPQQTPQLGFEVPSSATSRSRQAC